jgi:hypothetical protein
MGKSRYADAIGQYDKRNLDDQPIGDGPRWLGIGWHDVTVMDVDIEPLAAKDKFFITFEDDKKSQHRESIFVLNRNKNELSYILRMMISSLFPEQDSMDVFDTMLRDEHMVEHAFQCLRGMKLGIKIGYTKGYIIVEEDGYYYAEDSQDPGYRIERGNTYEQAESRAQREGYKKAFRNLIKCDIAKEDSDVERNLEALDAAYEAISKAKEAEGHSDEPESAGFTGADTPEEGDREFTRP